MNAKTDSVRAISLGVRLFLSGTALSRVSGLLRDLVMAAAFGSAPAVAAFLMAFRFSHLPRRLFGEGAMHSAFIPQFEGLRLADPRRAADLYRHLTLAIGLILSAILLFGEALVGSWLFWGSPSESQREVLVLTGAMLPVLLFVCLYGMNSALLGCGQRFFLPSVAPAFLNLSWIAAIFLFWGVETGRAMVYLSFAVVVGGAIQWGVTMPSVVRSLRQLSGGLSTSYRGFWRSADLRRIWPPLLLGIMGLGAAQINSALDPIFARMADAQGPAYLWYAIRVQQLPLALFGISLARVLLPSLSRAVKSGDVEQFRSQLGFAVRRAFAVMVPLSFGIGVAGVTAINLIYGRGHFDSAATWQTTYCLWSYGWGLLPMTLIMILGAPLYAMDNYRTPALAGAIAVGCNATLNALFVLGFGWGAVSVAIATSISALVQVLLLVRALHRSRLDLPLAEWWPALVRIGSATTVAALVTWGAQQFNGGELPRAFVAQLIQFGGQSLLFGGLLLICSWLFGARDLLEMVWLSRRSPAEPS